jgi:probable F420-dependent oxidoreductase
VGAKRAVGRVGMWTVDLRADDPARRGEVAEAAAELEELGYGAIWVGGSPGVGRAVPLIEATSRIVVATAILSIWHHPAQQVAAQFAAVEHAYPERFLLGLGASHPHLASGYRQPYTAVREYLDALDDAAQPVPVEWRVLAALGPRMLALAGEQAAGAHPYLVTADHTAQAREILGPQPLLAPAVTVVLETDPDRARAAARSQLAPYLDMPNYTNNFRRLGFGPDDLAGGGSDRLVDALFPWGDVDRIVAAVAEFYSAGADHLALQVVRAARPGLPRAEWRQLATAFDLGGGSRSD